MGVARAGAACSRVLQLRASAESLRRVLAIPAAALEQTRLHYKLRTWRLRYVSQQLDSCWAGVSLQQPRPSWPQLSAHISDTQI